MVIHYSMSSISENIVRLLIRHPKINAAIVIISICLFSAFAMTIRFENSIESFISPRDPDLIYYQQYKEEFGDDQTIVLVIPMGEVFTSQNLKEIDEISRALEEVSEIRKVRSL